MSTRSRREALPQTIVVPALVVAWCAIAVRAVLAQQGTPLPAPLPPPPAISPVEGVKAGPVPPLPAVPASDPGAADKLPQANSSLPGGIAPSSPPIPSVGSATGVSVAPKPAPPKVAPFPWVLRIEVVSGRTQLTAETSKGIQIRLICDQLNLQAPEGLIEAKGGVRISSAGSEATCDRLTITWQDDRITLEGKVQMKSGRDGMEISGDRVSLRLTAAQVARSSTKAESRAMPHKAETRQKDSVPGPDQIKR
jgi:hypothetical protein